MRNLEDCKAEVFRRSEERIKERKRTRNRVLTCCIPLCLLLVAGGLYIRPLLEPVDERMAGTAEDAGVSDRELGGLSSGTTVAFTSVTITNQTENEAVSRSVADAKEVEELRGFLAMYFDMSGATVKEEMADGADRDTIRDELKNKYDLEEPPADYKLVFQRSAGEESVFRLLENNLYNENNGCVVKLSDAMSAELKKRIAKALEADDDE